MNIKCLLVNDLKHHMFTEKYIARLSSKACIENITCQEKRDEELSGSKKKKKL